MAAAVVISWLIGKALLTPAFAMVPNVITFAILGLLFPVEL